MHTLTIVLLPPDTQDLLQAGAGLLKAHRLDDSETRRTCRLDYWTIGDGTIEDAVTAQALGVDSDPELAPNVCFVPRLRPDFVPGAIVTPDGRWYDLFDHGWRLLDGDTPENRAAEAAWASQTRALFSEHVSCVAIEFDTHS